MSGGSVAQTLTEFYSGKVIIITGASSGIGASLAHMLASIPGTVVIISSRSMEKLEEVAHSCRLENPSARVFPVVLDLENFEGVDQYTANVMETLRKNGLPSHVDVLINNAGVSSRGAAMETSMSTVQKIMVYSGSCCFFPAIPCCFLSPLLIILITHLSFTITISYQHINFYGPVALSQSIAAHMIAGGGGAIGVVSSVQGKLGNIIWLSVVCAILILS